MHRLYAHIAVCELLPCIPLHVKLKRATCRQPLVSIRPEFQLKIMKGGDERVFHGGPLPNDEGVGRCHAPQGGYKEIKYPAPTHEANGTADSEKRLI